MHSTAKVSKVKPNFSLYFQVNKAINIGKNNIKSHPSVSMSSSLNYLVTADKTCMADHLLPERRELTSLISSK